MISHHPSQINRPALEDLVCFLGLCLDSFVSSCQVTKLIECLPRVSEPGFVYFLLFQRLNAAHSWLWAMGHLSLEEICSLAKRKFVKALVMVLLCEGELLCSWFVWMWLCINGIALQILNNSLAVFIKYLLYRSILVASSARIKLYPWFGIYCTKGAVARYKAYVLREPRILLHK